MKIRNLILVIILATFGLTSKAGNDEIGFEQNIISKMKYPEYALVQLLKTDVCVSFTVTNDGNIIINQSNSINPDIMEYVENVLKSFKVNSENEVIGKTFYYRFTFKVEE